MFKIFLFLFLFLIPLQAGELPQQRLAWQMEGGDVRNIARLCRQYVQKKFEAQKTFSVETLLQDRDVARACYMAHFFSLVGKDRTHLLHELKDKEYVQWLLGHPEVFKSSLLPVLPGRIRWLCCISYGEEKLTLSLNSMLSILDAIPVLVVAAPTE